MRYTRSIRFVFDHPRWFVNLLLILVCQMIPVVGPIVINGYLTELVLSLHRHGDSDYPAFNFERFVDYLKRGVWPFLAVLILALALWVVIGCMCGCGLGLVFVIIGVLTPLPGQGPQQHDMATLPLIFLAIGMALFTLVVSVLVQCMIVPVTLRAAFEQRLGSAFSPRFVVDFIKRTWLESIVAMLFTIAAGIALMIGGVLLCVVGVYIAIPILMLSQRHLHWQLYELYVQRGGERFADTATPLPATPLPAR